MTATHDIARICTTLADAPQGEKIMVLALRDAAAEIERLRALACGYAEMRKALDGLLKVFVEDLGECGYDEDDIADHAHVKAARSILERTGDKP